VSAQSGGLNPATAPARSFTFDDARDAMATLAGFHPSGKQALVLDRDVGNPIAIKLGCWTRAGRHGR